MLYQRLRLDQSLDYQILQEIHLVNVAKLFVAHFLKTIMIDE